MLPATARDEQPDRAEAENAQPDLDPDQRADLGQAIDADLRVVLGAHRPVDERRDDPAAELGDRQEQHVLAKDRGAEQAEQPGADQQEDDRGGQAHPDIRQQRQAEQVRGGHVVLWERDGELVSQAGDRAQDEDRGRDGVDAVVGRRVQPGQDGRAEYDDELGGSRTRDDRQGGAEEFAPAEAETQLSDDVHAAVIRDPGWIDAGTCL